MGVRSRAGEPRPDVSRTRGVGAGSGTASDAARAKDGKRRRSGEPAPRRARLLPAVLAGVLVTGGVGCALAPTATGALAAQGMRSTALSYERVVLREEGGSAAEEARAMNDELAGRGYVSMTDDGAPAGYWTWSGIGADGVMATLSVPRLGLVLPVRAGTSDGVLARGLGHLSGTSLPVGGEGTHCVVAGHTDYRDLELFTHIGELEPGDVVTLSSAAGRLRYAVAQVRVTDPQDTGSLLAQPGRDLLTLLTCYPPGVNTHRLLVTCERVEDGDARDAGDSPAPETTSPGPEVAGSEGGQGLSGHLPGWAVAALCALVSLASGAIAALASAYPAMCARRRERAKAPQAQADELIPCTGTQVEGRRAGAGRR